MNLSRACYTLFHVRKKYSTCLSENTIFNICSGYGKCGVSVIRVSGNNASTVLQKVVCKPEKIVSRTAHLLDIFHPVSRELIDRGLILWFPKPFSFTGEDTCEFHVHGSPAVVSSLLKALGDIKGLRLAEPGEFTRRAFLNGKLDLTEVEGLADLIHAETEMQRKQALFQSKGFLSKKYSNWRSRLIKSIAHLEAFIDFAEDESIEDDTLYQLKEDLSLIREEIKVHLDDNRKGELLRNGIRTTIVGAPNAGKSSFLNLICNRRKSIVSAIPGTTRDVIESMQDIGGYPVIFSDTAGLRQNPHDTIEAEGICLTKESISESNIILVVIDASALDKSLFYSQNLLKKHIEDQVTELHIDDCISKEQTIKIILNKIDLLTNEEVLQLSKLDNLILISCAIKTNIEHFLHIFRNTLINICGQPQIENPNLTNKRHRQQLKICMNTIDMFLEEYGAFEIETDMAIAAAKLKIAIKCIEKITGHVSSDEIIDIIFKDFCIGK